MAPRIAIPMPHSTDHEYGARAILQYERAVESVGGEPVRIPLNQSASDVLKIIERCNGVLLPGSNADVDPVRFNAPRSPHTTAADPRRDAVDNLLLEDAYKRCKPVLGICYGLQSLNVYRRGSLVQHIPDFLPVEQRGKVDHAVGNKAVVAHTVEIEGESRLARIVRNGTTSEAEVHTRAPAPSAALEALRHPKSWLRSVLRRADAISKQNQKIVIEDHRVVVPVNSSHHQSADVVGEGLRIVARCPDDGIIEAVEGTETDHFVVAVQWHPERSVYDDTASRAIFQALIDAAR